MSEFGVDHETVHPCLPFSNAGFCQEQRDKATYQYLAGLVPAQADHQKERDDFKGTYCDRRARGQRITFDVGSVGCRSRAPTKVSHRRIIVHALAGGFETQVAEHPIGILWPRPSGRPFVGAFQRKPPA